MNKFKIERALISVFDKSYLLDLVRILAGEGVEILSSGGTANTIRTAGYEVTDIADYTGSPEVFSGRVKTLHPMVHGGILLRRDNEVDLAEAQANGIPGIDLVVVNLYPFIEKASAETTVGEALELIDIGGVTLLRAAAKNYKDVAVLHNSRQYHDFIQMFTSEYGIPVDMRKRWAGEVFAHVAEYDNAIAARFSDSMFIAGRLKKELRYGENPHQKSRWYVSEDYGISRAQQLWGKEMSHLNILDLDAAMNITADFEEPACVIIKHTTPCGLAIGEKPLKAYERAFSCDTRSPFGGIVGFNRGVDEETAEKMAEIFLEAIIAPEFSAGALTILKKKKNLRLLKTGKFKLNPAEKKIVSVSGGFLAQESDNITISRDDFKVVSKLQPTEEQWQALVFGAKAVKWAKSNAVVLNDRFRTLGIGCGQTSRVGSVEIAVANARLFGHSLKGAVMASDAFFPFPDSMEEAAKVGVKAVVQPGGSIRDQEVIEAANDLGVAMVFTGKRHFRH